MSVSQFYQRLREGYQEMDRCPHKAKRWRYWAVVFAVCHRGMAWSDHDPSPPPSPAANEKSDVLPSRTIQSQGIELNILPYGGTLQVHVRPLELSPDWPPVAPRLTRGTASLLRFHDKITKIHIEGVLLEERAVAEIARLPRLKEVVLVRTNVRDEDLQDLAKCPTLEALTVHSGFVTERSIPAFCRQRQLRSLALYWTPFLSKSHAEVLHKCLPNAYLLINEYEFDPKVPSEQTANSSRRVLESQKEKKRPEVQAAENAEFELEVANVRIAVMANGSRAVVRGSSGEITPRLSEDLLGILDRFHTIENLTIERAIIEPGTFSVLPKMANLKRLELIETTIDDEQLCKLPECKSLESILIRDGLVTVESYAIFMQMPKLRRIQLDMNRFLPIIPAGSKFKKMLKQFLPDTKVEIDSGPL